MIFIETNELRKIVNEEYYLLRSHVDDKYWEEIDDYYCFKKGYDNSPPGTYVYSDYKGYHMDTVGDRGGIVDRIVSDDVSEIYYNIYDHLTFTVAVKYAESNRIKGQDWRRIMFKYQLELLKHLGELYYSRKKEEIDKILFIHPYDDSLFKDL